MTKHTLFVGTQPLKPTEFQVNCDCQSAKLSSLSMSIDPKKGVTLDSLSKPRTMMEERYVSL